MRLLVTVILFAMTAFGPSAYASDAPNLEERQRQVDKATEVLYDGNPAEAVRLVEPVIAAFDAEHVDKSRTYFCAADNVAMLTLLGQSAAAKKDAVVLASTWCDALFVKGFALIDLKRLPEAGAFLERAAEMDALNAHYINEYAEWHKSNRNWQRSFDLFEKARDAAAYAPEKYRPEFEARSLRGMGFTKIELGDLDLAEKYFRDSLKLVPKHQGALQELDYIKTLRKK